MENPLFYFKLQRMRVWFRLPDVTALASHGIKYITILAHTEMTLIDHYQSNLYYAFGKTVTGHKLIFKSSLSLEQNIIFSIGVEQQKHFNLLVN